MADELITRALNAAATVLEYDADACLHCNYGDGATGKNSEGGPCEECQEVHGALALVHQALVLTSSGEPK